MKSLSLAISAAIFSSAHAAPVNPTVDAKTLDEIEVRAERVERREQALRHAQHGASTVEIGRERLNESNIIGTEDFLRYAPNLTVRSRYIGDRNALIGGRSNSTIQGSRSLVYIDGLLISDLLGASFNPPRWGMVSPAEIQQVDVLYGPFTAEFPGNSMGTTVQITTRYPRAFKMTADAQLFSQAFNDDYGNDDDYRGNRANVTAGESHERWRWFAALSRLDTTSHPMQYATPSSFITTGAAALPLLNGAISDLDPQARPRVILGPTGIEDTQQYNAKFKLGFDLSEDTTLELVSGHWRNDYDRRAQTRLTDAAGLPVFAGSYRLPDGRGIRIANNAFAPQSGNERHWQNALSLTSRLSDAWSLQIIGSDYAIRDNTLRSSTQTPIIARTGGAGTVSKGDGTGWNTLDAHFVGELENHTLRLGFHGDRYVLDQRVFSNEDWRSGAQTLRTSVFGGKARNTAAFVQDRWRFADAWALDFGARYERWSAYSGVRASGTATVNYPTRDLNKWSPNFGVRRELGDTWTLRASVAKATRFPTVSELFQGSISGNAIINSDPNLKPEVSYAKELALEGMLFGGNARFSLFEDDIRDSLFSQTNFSVFPTITNIQNIGRIRNRGLELVSEWDALADVEGLSLSASAAFNRSRILDNPNFPASIGKRAPRIPKTRASAVLSYRPDEQWRLSLAGRYSGRQWNTLDNTDINPNTFGGTSDFTVFDFKVQRKLGDGFALGVGVDNLNDERYFAFHPYPSRTVFIELRYGD